MSTEMHVPDADPLDVKKLLSAEIDLLDNRCAVSGGAVLAGAAAAAAVSLVLLILGFGLGLFSIAPWPGNTAHIGQSTILWMALSQLAAAGIGGYLAGRLRGKWAGVAIDEVYLRDIVHGLLAWAVATLVTAALLAGAVGVVTSGAMASASLGEAGRTADRATYFSDMLVRADQGTQMLDNGLRAEIANIFSAGVSAGTLPADDQLYLSRRVARHTGITQTEADKRVATVYARLSQARADAGAAAKEAADKARTFAAHSALWMGVALLLGALFASVCATLGGRQRDDVVTTSSHSG